MSVDDPQMLPACIGYKVTTPAVAELMSNNINVLTITADDRRCGKGVDGVLHTFFCQNNYRI